MLQELLQDLTNPFLSVLQDLKNIQLRLFQDLTLNPSKDCKPKKIEDCSVFDDKYIKYKGECYEQLTIEKYLENIRLDLWNKINDFKKSGEWKIHLAMKINFMSSNVNEEKCLMHSKIDSEEMITAFNTRNHHWRAFSFAFAEVSSRFRITNEG